MKMIIEIFKDNNGFISGFRHSWDIKSKNKPIKENIYKIEDYRFLELCWFINGGTSYLTSNPPDIVIKSGEGKKKPTFKTGNLELRNLDYQKNIDYKFFRYIQN